MDTEEVQDRKLQWINNSLITQNNNNNVHVQQVQLQSPALLLIARSLVHRDAANYKTSRWLAAAISDQQGSKQKQQVPD